MRNAEDIGVVQRALPADAHLERFAGLEVDQQLLHQQLCDLVARNRRHRVPGDAAAAAHRDIRRARADIDQHQVQQPDIDRDRRVKRRNRLQRQAGHLKPSPRNHGIQAVDDLPREEGCNHIDLHDPAPVPVQRGQRVAVQPVLGRGIADHIKAALAAAGDRALRRRDRTRFQLVDQLVVRLPRLGEFHRKAGPRRAERTPRRRHAHPLQADMLPRFQPFHDRLRNRRDLRDIFDLAVQHGAPPVGLFFNIKHAEAPAFLAPQHAHDTARANIKCKNGSPVLHRHGSRLLPAARCIRIFRRKCERPGPHRCRSGSGAPAGGYPPPH